MATENVSLERRERKLTRIFMMLQYRFIFIEYHNEDR
jgi:hypothetical protein